MSEISNQDNPNADKQGRGQVSPVSKADSDDAEETSMDHQTSETTKEMNEQRPVSENRSKGSSNRNGNIPTSSNTAGESQSPNTKRDLYESDDSDFENDPEPGEIQVDTEKKSPISMNRLYKCLKIVYLVLLFLLILGTGCLSRVLIHIMIWKLSPPNTNDRNLKLVSIFGYLEPNDNIITRNSSCMDLSCSKGLPLKWTCTDIDNQTCTLAEEIPSTNITWLWAVMILISAPYLYAFITTFSRYCTKFSHKINIKILVVGVIRDLFHSAALCLLVFFVLPTMAPDMAAMTVFLVTCIPAVLNLNLRRFLPHMKIIVDNRKALKEEQKVSVPKSRSEFFYALIPVVLFFLSLIFFAVVVGRSSYANIYLVLEIILSCVFVSVEWFENFIIFNKTNVVSITNKSGKKAYLYSEKRDKILKGGVQPFRWVYLFAACSKEREICVLALLKLVSLNVIFFPFIIGVITDWKVVWGSFLFEPNVNASLPSYIHSKMNLESSDQISFGCNSSTPFVVMIICACSTFVFFKLAQHACRIMYQKSEFVIPIFLNLIITPFVIAAVQLNNQLFIVDGCSVLQPLWKTTFDWEYLDPWLLRISGMIGSISVFLLIRKLLWRKTDIPLQQVTKLFSKTTYCGLYPDVSLLLSRKADEKLTYVEGLHQRAREKYKPEDPKEEPNDAQGENKSQLSLIEEEPSNEGDSVKQTSNEGDSVKQTSSEGDSVKQTKMSVPIIIACATMWHETYDEMCKLLNSVLRLGIATTEHKEFGFEAHIFFDDAFIYDATRGPVLNEYAEYLCQAIKDSKEMVYEEKDEGENDGKVTEYGWRFIWEIKGRNAKDVFRSNAVNDWTRLVVHFKDKAKIRVKKRWSQVMYMHYLLTRRFGPRKVDEVLANLESTFILALDGDVDFQPEAVSFLLQGIKKNERVGACCGRIHPIGSGPMVWYQKFEYAASHWLQKATEHVCGCVLCSPGCFTLMRGSALLDNNVLRKYSTEPKTPWQMVQFDQGEDRWLCTLLLTQGHRIEYCAASDAKTFAPEGFMEFFKQRRRWSPSTIANIIDILSKFSYCAKKNDSISKLYLAYQAFLLCTAIITPASILLLMIGATVIAFSLEPWLAMILVILPTLFFTISIFASEEETQLFLASIISGLYAIAMVVVLIGIFKAGIEAGFCSETTILICFVGGIFVVAAILHPREWTCILPGLLYFFAVPAVSVILMIYAIGNIHVTSWGTRELTVDKKQKGREVACGFGDVCRCTLFPAKSSTSGDSPKLDEIRDVSVHEGTKLVLKTKVTGYPKPKITWYKDKARIHRSKHVIKTFNASTARLKIKDITVNESGNYCCVAENQEGRCTMEVKVKVIDKETKDFIPYFKKEDSKGEAISKYVRDDAIVLEADVIGVPEPMITWKRNEKEIRRDGIFKLRKCGSNVSLKITDKKEFNGTFTCVAENTVGTTEVQIESEDAVQSGGKGRIPIPTTSVSDKERKYWKMRIDDILNFKKNELTATEQDDLSAKLKDLRNKVFFGFILINAIYFTFVFTLTQADATFSQVSFEIPCPDTAGVLRLNPILIAFILTFGIVLLIQFWGMIYHRLSTFVHIILSVKLDFKRSKIGPENSPQVTSQGPHDSSHIAGDTVHGHQDHLQGPSDQVTQDASQESHATQQEPPDNLNKSLKSQILIKDKGSAWMMAKSKMTFITSFRKKDGDVEQMSEQTLKKS